MFVSAFISFTVFYLLMSHISPRIMRRIVGYKGYADIVLHGVILWMFLGTSTEGLMQAEAAGICFSLYLRGYYWYSGYERRINGRWVRFAGQRHAAPTAATA